MKVNRYVRSVPERSATETWGVVVGLLTQPGSDAEKELVSITGVASSLIASEYMDSDPVVARGGGPYVNVFCLYDDDAIDGDRAGEDALSSCPTAGDGWRVSLPCAEEDLAWVSSELAALSSRVTARPLGSSVANAANSESSSADLTIDTDSFLRE